MWGSCSGVAEDSGLLGCDAVLFGLLDPRRWRHNIPSECQGPLTWELMCYFEEKNLYIVIGCHSKSQHVVWGSTNCNDNGAAILDILNSTNLGILNQGNVHTFCTASRLEVIDITLGCFGLLESFKNWEVSCEPFMSYHRHILFNLGGSILMHLIRNPRGTNWDSLGRDWRAGWSRVQKWTWSIRLDWGFQFVLFSRL